MRINDLNIEKYVKDYKSFSKLNELNLPTKFDEDFRNIDLEPLFNKEFTVELPKIINDLNHNFDMQNLYYLYIINDKIIVHYSDLPIGVEIKNETKEFVETNNALYYLSEVFLDKTEVLHITKELEEPIVLINVFTEDNTFYPNSLKIKVDDYLKAEIIDVFLSNTSESFANINRTFELGEHAILNYYKDQDMGNNALVLNNVSAIKEKAQLDIFSFEISNSYHINLWENFLASKNSTINFNGLVNLYNNSFMANIINTYHDNENIYSNIDIRHILHDNSKAIFKAKTVVNQNASHSEAYQNSKTILLSDNATIYAKPHLEILVDELKASHGATVGSLDKEQLYYLQSRGIKENEAKTILLKAFEAKVYDKITSPVIKEFILGLKRSSYV